jgi:hypothetical protein
MTRRDPNASPSFLSDFAESFNLARERRDAAELVGSRIERRDAAAQAVARELNEPDLAHHVHALAAALGVRVEHVRAAVAREVGGARTREDDARRAVQGGKP